MELYSGGGASICTVDNDGTVHHWKLLSSDRNGPKQEVIVPSLPVFGRIHTIKIKCSQCGREYILFDSRFNGYSGKFCANATDEEAAYIPHFKQKSVGMACQLKSVFPWSMTLVMMSSNKTPA